MRRRTLAGVVAAVVVVLSLPASHASTRDRDKERPTARVAAVDETLELVNVVIDRSGMLFPERWQISETSASLDTDLYSHEHSWTIPSVIPPAGASATVTTSATAKPAGGRISALTALSGYILIDGGTSALSVFANADISAGQPTVTTTRTVTLSPRGGGPVSLRVVVQDGPTITFNYKIVTPPAPPPAPPPPAPAPPPPGRTLSFPAPRPGAVESFRLPTIPGGAIAATVALGLTDSLGAPLPPPRVAALTDRPDRVIPRLDREDPGSEALLICYIITDVTEQDLLDFLSNREEWDEFFASLTTAARKRLRSFLVCNDVAQRALKLPPAPRATAYAAQLPCTATAIRIAWTRRRVRLTRVRPPRLNVGCVRTDTNLRLSISPRKRNARLRTVVGPRLRLSVGRGAGAAQPGDKLNATLG